MVTVQTDTQQSSLPDEVASPVRAAQEAGLRYVSDTMPGIRRKHAGKHFTYLGPDDKPIKDKQTIERIRHIGIPPAWKDVWICTNPRGHIQATGRDAKGRKQYRYHSEWRKVRDATKYDRISEFGKALPEIRARVAHDLTLQGLPREKVLATVVRLLDATSIRIGNDEYARENGSFGLTTMQHKHVDVQKSTVHFHFKGKSGKEHEISVHDRQLASIVRHCHDLPGYELFQYVDDQQEAHVISSDDVNAYLQEISGHAFTAKDFRIWSGTVAATCALIDIGEYETQTQAKKNVVRAIEQASEHLGNTPAICRKSYVHPEIIDAYLDGSLLAAAQKKDEHALEESLHGLRPDELAVLAFLDA